MSRPKRKDGRNSTIAAIQKYNENNYDRVVLNLKKGNKELLQNAAAAAGLSVNNYIGRMLEKNIPGFKALDSENSLKSSKK